MNQNHNKNQLFLAVQVLQQQQRLYYHFSKSHQNGGLIKVTDKCDKKKDFLTP
jgi:hypothetical protein